MQCPVGPSVLEIAEARKETRPAQHFPVALPGLVVASNPGKGLQAWVRGRIGGILG